MSQRAIRMFQAGIAAILVVGLAHVWLLIQNPNPELSASIRAISVAGRLLHIAVGAGVLLYAADRAEGRALAVFAALSAFGTRPLKAYLGFPPETADLVATMAHWASLAALLRFCALFPAPLTPAMLAADPRRGIVRRLARAPVRWAAALALRLTPVEARARLSREVRPGLAVRGAFLRAPWVWGAASLTALASATSEMRGAGYGVLVSLVAVAGVLLGFHYLRTGYRAAGPEERRRVLWLMTGCGAMIWSVALVFVVLTVSNMVAVLSGGTSALQNLRLGFLAGALLDPVMSVILAFTVFYQGALDPRLAIRVVSQYGLLGIVLSVLFAFVENVAASTVAAGLGLSDATGSALAGAAAGLAFGPMRDFLNRALARLFSGSRAPAPAPAPAGALAAS